MRSGRARSKPQSEILELAGNPEYYTKSRTLYGLNLTKGDLRKGNFALIVRGLLRFSQVAPSGRISRVATCGTALTSQQAQMLRRFAPKAVLCYDPDRAGQTAAERSSELLVSEGFDVNVVQLPGGADPDAFIQKQGREAFVVQLKRSRPYLEFLLDRAAAEHDLTRDDSRREYTRWGWKRASHPAAARSIRGCLAHNAMSGSRGRAEIGNHGIEQDRASFERSDAAGNIPR